MRKSSRRISKKLICVITILVLLLTLLPVGALAEEVVTPVLTGMDDNGGGIIIEAQGGTVMRPMALADYDSADVAFINSMIDNNGLGWTKFASPASDPADWTGVGWNDDSPKRITSLSLDNMGLTGAIDVSGLGALTYLSCWDNDLTSLGTLPASLTFLSCYENKLTSLDVTNCTSLTYLSCGSNKLTSLGALPASLTTLYCQDNDLTSLGTLPASLTYLSCGSNKLTSLGALPASLTFLSCGSNKLTSLGALPASLTTLYCDKNKLTDLGTLPASLTDLYCYDNKLTDLGTLPASLTYFACENNDLTSLDVTNCTSLTFLNCRDNDLTSLDVSNCTSLTYLSCDTNKLTSLGTLPASLTYLSCSGNKLTSLDVSNCTSLTTLECRNNDLTSLDVANCTSLTSLSCGSNKLTSLGVLPASLTLLGCYNNDLTSLDLTGLTSLNSLYCSGNPLSVFTTANGNKLTVSKTNGVTMGIPNDPSPIINNNFGYNIITSEITLTAVPGTGRTFERWILPAGAVFTNNTTETSNPVSFTLNGSMDVVPVFQYNVLSAPADYTGDGQERVISVDGDIAYYTETMVDGNTAPATAKAGSTIVTLPGNYLDTLASGNRNVRVLFTDGYATATLNVNASQSTPTPTPLGTPTPTPSGTPTPTPSGTPTPTPSGTPTPTPLGTPTAGTSSKTGDTSNIGLWLALMAIAGAGLIGAFLYRRRTMQKHR